MENHIVTQRTILGWGLAAALLAGCSGGTGGTSSSGLTTVPGALVQLRIDTSKLFSSTSHTPKYLGAAINAVHYAFAGGSAPTGDLSLPSGTCPASGNPPTYLCSITVPAFAYTGLTVTLNKCTTPPAGTCTAIGNGVNGAITITSGNTTNVTITVSPVNAHPVIAVTGGQQTQFYQDNVAQNINLTVNEVDPAGDIIDAFYGAVTNWPNLIFSLANGTAGVGAPANIMAAPNNGGAGTTLAGVTYDGSSANAQTLTVNVTDGTTPASILIPFISMTESGATLNVQSLGANGCGGAACTVTITESATSAATIDAKFSSSSNCGTHVTFTPTLGTAGSGNATGATTTSGAVTYTIVANDVYSGVGTCTMTVTSQQDANLSQAVVINFPGIAGTTLTGHGRSNR
jgi:hypothetical protein